MESPSFQRVKSGAGIRLHQVSKSYGSTPVIPELSVELLPGEFTVILGPSGCGKSTLLQMIAGLETVSSGSILIAGREVQQLEPKQRGCAMVFQNYALYPHMTVFDNIAYSLRIAGIKRPERQRRVAKVAEMLGLSAYLARRPSQLSGGQRQRVAIGRAIVREPQVLLFDEPLSNLDAQLRHEMRIELADLHSRIGATSLFVTHDQAEAMTLADRILILNQGRIEQFATPQEIYHRPATVFVARFVGSPAMNLIPVEGDGSALRSASGEILAHSQQMGQFLLGIRSEDILMMPSETELPGVSARFRYREEMGSHAVLMTELSCGSPLQVTTPFGDTHLVVPDYLTLYFPAHRLHLFETQSGLVIPDSFITE